MGTEEDLRGDIRFYFDGQIRILDRHTRDGYGHALATI